MTDPHITPNIGTSCLSPFAAIAKIAVAVFAVGFLLMLLLSSFNRRGDRRPPTCQDHVRQLLVAFQMYQQDNDGKFPDSQIAWKTVTLPPKYLKDPDDPQSRDIDYGYNAHLSELTLKSPGMLAEDELPVLGDSATPNHLLKSWASLDYRHHGKATIGYADGHVVLCAPGPGVKIVPIVAPAPAGS